MHYNCWNQLSNNTTPAAKKGQKGFTKGVSGNPNGRPQGVPSARLVQWEELGECIRTTHTERFNQILAELPPDKFVPVYLQILEYFKPKLVRSESYNLNQQVEPVTISIDAATVPAFPSNVDEVEAEEVPAQMPIVQDIETIKQNPNDKVG